MMMSPFERSCAPSPVEPSPSGPIACASKDPRSESKPSTCTPDSITNSLSAKTPREARGVVLGRITAESEKRPVPQSPVLNNATSPSSSSSASTQYSPRPKEAGTDCEPTLPLLPWETARKASLRPASAT